MFADDLASLNANRRALKESINVFSQWALHWKMNFNVSKCGILYVQPQVITRLHLLDPVQFMLQGEHVPIITEYKYLGVIIDENLSLDRMVANRVEKARNILATMRFFLSARTIPLYARLVVYKAVFFPIALYGAEIWGMNQLRIKSLETLRKQCMRILLGFSSSSTIVPIVTASRELDIPPIHALASARRARAFISWRNSRLWIGKLLQNPVRMTREFCSIWSISSRRWLLTFAPHGVKRVVTSGNNADLSNDEIRTLVTDHWWSRFDKSHISKLGKPYKRHHVYESNSYLSLSMSFPTLSLGFKYLTMMRIGTFMTASRLAKMSLIDVFWGNHCPCCDAGVEESIQHILLI